ncbi:MAG TPA: sigma-70 family RNA polymerase sigma factor [Rudaea sp.]|nr:sigma-70 family RNA polymerase sigma factor [Rudaea sp.]HSC11755.1 sigma-70 family RNA polymerase sigma factor [Rhodanobacteraceae bacterium]
MTEATATDQEHLRDLLGATARGDSSAFEQLYRSTSARLFGICLRILPQRGDAEDVLQEVFATIWRKATQYDPALASPITWLAMLARNRAIDRLRAGGQERRSAPIDLAEDVADAAPSPAAASELGDDRRRLSACMDQLDTQRRKLIRIAFFEGATYEELAARCGSPLGTVKSWIRRGLAQLKACLEQ